jgi:hypothetical protein
MVVKLSYKEVEEMIIIKGWLVNANTIKTLSKDN